MGFSTRKIKSHAQLKQWRVRINLDLPEIETVETSFRRSQVEVAERAIGLAKVYLTSQNAPHSVLDATLDPLDIAFLTYAEKAFVQNGEGLSVNAASWRVESLWTLLWALGWNDELSPPFDLCDVNLAIGRIRSKGITEFIAESRLRDQEELLDYCDLIYRAHWAVVDSSLTNLAVPLDPGVVKERSWALNWLVQDTEWDEVSLDT